jgi:hypothetical protein
MIVDSMANAFIQQWVVNADVPGSSLNRVPPLPGSVARHIRLGVIILAHLDRGAAGNGQDGKQQTTEYQGSHKNLPGVFKKKLTMDVGSRVLSVLRYPSSSINVDRGLKNEPATI